MSHDCKNLPDEPLEEAPWERLLGSGSTLVNATTSGPLEGAVATLEVKTKKHALHAVGKSKCSTSAIDFLPPELARNRVLGSADAAAFWGVSLPHWRRMYRLGQVPKPIRLSVRKLGWRVGDLVDALAARSAA